MVPGAKPAAFQADDAETPFALANWATRRTVLGDGFCRARAMVGCLGLEMRMAPFRGGRLVFKAQPSWGRPHSKW